VALGQVFSENFGFPCQSTFNLLSTIIFTITRGWHNRSGRSANSLTNQIKKKVGWEDISKPTIGNENLPEININNNEVRVLNFDTSKSIMFPHRNIHRFILISPDGMTHNQFDHTLIDRRRHSNILDVRSFRAADCDTGHYLVVAKIRERLAVSKQTMHRVHIERFSLKK
jgi:hypothetical protein